MKKGKFIVIEGADGSGKETQTKLLINKLREYGFKVKVMDFPQYEKTFFGRLVGRFLKGEFGSLKDVSPYLASLTFAGDRWQAKDEINKFLGKGYMVVSNRYALSNMGHQASKLPIKKREVMINFLYKLEYKIFQIPKEDLDIVLLVPPVIGRELVDKKQERKYLRGKRKRDIQEANLKYQKECYKTYLMLSQKFDSVRTIDCVKDGKLMSIGDIHKLVWKKVCRGLKIKNIKHG